MATPALAQTQRAWIDVNALWSSSSQDQETRTFNTILFDEAASGTVIYPDLESAVGGGTSGGVNIHPRIGVGAFWTRTRYEQTVGLGIRVPSPFVFNSHASDVGVTDRPLERTENAVDISAMFTVTEPGNPW